MSELSDETRAIAAYKAAQAAKRAKKKAKQAKGKKAPLHITTQGQDVARAKAIAAAKARAESVARRARAAASARERAKALYDGLAETAKQARAPYMPPKPNAPVAPSTQKAYDGPDGIRRYLADKRAYEEKMRNYQAQVAAGQKYQQRQKDLAIIDRANSHKATAKDAKWLESYINDAREAQKKNGESLDRNTVLLVHSAYRQYSDDVDKEFRKQVDGLSKFFTVDKDGKLKAKSQQDFDKGIAFMNTPEFKASRAEFNRLFGTQNQPGTYTTFMTQREELAQGQRDYLYNSWKSSMWSRIGAAKAAGKDEQAQQLENQMKASDWFNIKAIDPKKTGMKLVYDEELKRMVEVPKTVQEEYDSRVAIYEYQMKREISAAQNNAVLQANRLKRMQGIEYKSGADLKDQGVYQASQELNQAANAAGVSVSSLKNSNVARAFIEGTMMTQWDKDNKAKFFTPDQIAAIGQSGKHVDPALQKALALYQSFRKAASDRYYQAIGQEDAGLLGAAFDPRNPLGLAFLGLDSLLGGLGSAVKVGGTLATKDTFELVLSSGNLTVEKFPPDIQKQIRSRADQIYAGSALPNGHHSMDYDTALKRATNEVGGNWIKTNPAGEDWANKNDLLYPATGATSGRNKNEKTRIYDSLQSFYHNFYEEGVAGTPGYDLGKDTLGKLTGLSQYGVQPFTPDSIAANLAFGLFMDPTNAVPLKFWKWAERLRYAKAATSGKNPASRLVGGVHQWTTVNERELAIAKTIENDFKGLADNFDTKILADAKLQKLAGIGDPTEFQKAAEERLRAMGILKSANNAHEVDSLVQQVLQLYLERSGRRYQGVVEEAERLAREQKAAKAAERERLSAAAKADTARTLERESDALESARKTEAKVMAEKKAHETKLETAASAPRRPVVVTPPETLQREVRAALDNTPTTPRSGRLVENLTPNQRRSDQIVHEAVNVSEDAANSSLPVFVRESRKETGIFHRDLSVVSEHGFDWPAEWIARVKGTQRYKDLVKALGSENARAKLGVRKTPEAQAAAAELYEWSRRAQAWSNRRLETLGPAGESPRINEAGDLVTSGYGRYVPEFHDLTTRMGARTPGERAMALRERTFTEQSARQLTRWMAEHRKLKQVVLDAAQGVDGIPKRAADRAVKRLKAIEDKMVNQLSYLVSEMGPEGGRVVNSFMREFTDDGALEILKASEMPTGRRMVEAALMGELTDFYGTLSLLPDIIKHVQSPTMKNIMSREWRDQLTGRRIGAFLRRFRVDADDLYHGFDAVKNPIVFRENMFHLFALMHMLKIDGNLEALAKIQKLVNARIVGTAETGSDLLNPYWQAWRVMETRAGLAGAASFKSVEDDFIDSLVNLGGEMRRLDKWGHGIHPNLALSMIPYGPFARRQPVRFGFSARLSRIPDTLSDLFSPAPAHFSDNEVRQTVYRMRGTAYKLKTGEWNIPVVREQMRNASRILHYTAERYGDFFFRRPLFNPSQAKNNPGLRTLLFYTEMQHPRSANFRHALDESRNYFRDMRDLGLADEAREVLKTVLGDIRMRVAGSAAGGVYSSAEKGILNAFSGSADDATMLMDELGLLPKIDEVKAAERARGMAEFMDTELDRLVRDRTAEEIAHTERAAAELDSGVYTRGGGSLTGEESLNDLVDSLDPILKKLVVLERKAPGLYSPSGLVNAAVKRAPRQRVRIGKYLEDLPDDLRREATDRLVKEALDRDFERVFTSLLNRTMTASSLPDGIDEVLRSAVQIMGKSPARRRFVMSVIEDLDNELMSSRLFVWLKNEAWMGADEVRHLGVKVADELPGVAPLKQRVTDLRSRRAELELDLPSEEARVHTRGQQKYERVKAQLDQLDVEIKQANDEILALREAATPPRAPAPEPQVMEPTVGYGRFDMVVPRGRPGGPARPPVAAVPAVFKHEPGYVYRVLNQSRLGETVEENAFASIGSPAGTYAADNSVITRMREENFSSRPGEGGHDAEKIVRADRGVGPSEVEVMAADGSWHTVLPKTTPLNEAIDDFAENIQATVDPPLGTEIQSASAARAQRMLAALTGMNEEEWLARQEVKYRAQRANPKLHTRTKLRAGQKLDDISKVRQLLRVAKQGGSYIPPHTRDQFANRMADELGERAALSLNPKMISPFIFQAAGAAVEQARSLYHRLMTAPVDKGLGNIPMIGDVSETYLKHGDALDAIFDLEINPQYLVRLGIDPAHAQGITALDLLSNVDELFLSLQTTEFKDFMLELVKRVQTRARQQTGEPLYTVAQYLSDRVVHRGSFYDAKLFEQHDLIFAQAISDARGWRAKSTTHLPGRKGDDAPISTFAEVIDKDLTVVIAKARVAKQLGVNIHMYNEARKVLGPAMVRKRKSLALFAEATKRAVDELYAAGHTVNDKDWDELFLDARNKYFLSIRDEWTAEEAVRRLKELAAGEMYGRTADEVITEFEARYELDDTIRFTEPEAITPFQHRTLKSAVETWLDIDDAFDVGQAQRGLAAHGQRPPFENRGALRDWLTKYGVWSPRTAEAIEGMRRRTWSIYEEADYWRTHYAFVPDFANPALLLDGGARAIIKHDEEAYGALMRSDGLFNRNTEAHFVQGAGTREERLQRTIHGDEKLGLKAKRDLALERRYVIERYGYIATDDNGNLIAFPWLMTPEEHRTYFKTTARAAMSPAAGLLQTDDELDALLDLIERHVDAWYTKHVPTEEVVTFEDLFRASFEITEDLLADPRWTARRRDMAGEILSIQQHIRVGLVFTQLGFASTNVVDSFIKEGWIRVRDRAVMTDNISDDAKATTLFHYGMDTGTQLLRDLPVHGVERIKRGKTGLGYGLVRDLEGSPAKMRAWDALIGASEVPAEIAGFAEKKAKLRLAQGMYDQMFARFYNDRTVVKKFGTDLKERRRYADAAARKEIGERIQAAWPTVGDGPIERLWNKLFPFFSYTIKNHVFYISEFMAHPVMFNYLERIGTAIEEYNVRQWEEQGIKPEDMDMKNARYIELPWAPGYFVDLGVITDIQRGIKPIYQMRDAKVPMTFTDLAADWVRFFSPNDINIAFGILNAFEFPFEHYFQTMGYRAELDEFGYPTGAYTQEALPWMAPWGQQASVASSIWPLEILSEFFKKGEGGFTAGEGTQLFAQLFMFGGIKVTDRGAMANELYWKLKDQDPAAADRFLLSDKGKALQAWWLDHAATRNGLQTTLFSPELRDILNPPHIDKNPWFHRQDPAFQQTVRTGLQELRAIGAKWDAQIWRLTPGTQEYTNAKLQAATERYAYLQAHPEMYQYFAMTMTPEEWAKTLDKFTTDALLDGFFAIKAPKKEDYASAAAYQAAVKLWKEQRAAYLKAFPTVAEALASSSTQLEAIWKTTEQDWFEILDRIGTRGIAIEALKDSKQFDLADQLYLVNDLDYEMLSRDVAVTYFDPATDFKTLGYDKYGNPIKGGVIEGLLPHVKVLPDFNQWRWNRMNGDERIAYEKNQKYIEGMKEVIAIAKRSGNFGAAFYREMKERPWLLKMWFDKNPGKREQWAANDDYIRVIGKFGRLMKAGKFDEAFRYFDSMPAWAKARYYEKHPERRQNATKNLEYNNWMSKWVAFYKRRDYKGGGDFFDSMPKWVKDRYLARHPGSGMAHGGSGGGSSPYSRAMGKWVKLLQDGKSEEARAYFKSLPQAYKDRYYAGHPEAKLRDDIKRTGQLAEYFAGNDGFRAQYLKDNPEFARWLRQNGNTASERRMLIQAAYRALPDDAWLRRVFREKFPEVFSKEATGEQSLKKTFGFLADHPNMNPAFEKWLAAIWASYADMVKNTGTRPKPLDTERVRRMMPAHGRGQSAAWVRLHSI